MLRKKISLLIVLLAPLGLSSIELWKDYLDYKDEHPLPKIADEVVYGDGDAQITSNINEYENIIANKPIQGSIFVTHDAKDTVDVSSFRLGSEPLKALFVQTSRMSPSSSIVVTIYSFQLEGRPIGSYTLPSITVKVAGKEIRALPLVIEVSQ